MTETPQTPGEAAKAFIQEELQEGISQDPDTFESAGDVVEEVDAN